VEVGRVDLHPEQAVEILDLACVESLRGSGLPNSTVVRGLFRRDKRLRAEILS
jgi:hypothetical protein